MNKKRAATILILSIAVFGCVFFFAAPASASGYTYYRTITVTSTTSIASGTNANFPMLVSSTLSSWASSGHGGHIQNLATAPNGGQEPADLVFATSSANCGTANLNFETEAYVSSTGALVDWVNVPSLSAGTVIYACYDNSSVTTDQSHPSSTWNSNYKGVWHMRETPTGSGQTIYDSTANSSDASTLGTWTSAQQVAGKIDGSLNFASGTAASMEVATTSSALNNPSALTVSFWLNPTSYTINANYFLAKYGVVNKSGWNTTTNN